MLADMKLRANLPHLPRIRSRPDRAELDARMARMGGATADPHRGARKLHQSGENLGDFGG